MTTDSIRFTPSVDGIVRAVLIDAVTEQLVHARGPAARAEIIAELVQEMCATVEWLHGTGLDDSRADELASISRLSRAARDHRRQVSAARHTDRPD